MFERSCKSVKACQQVKNTFAFKNPENANGVLLEVINDLNIRECKSLMRLFSGRDVRDWLFNQATFTLRHRMLNKFEEKAQHFTTSVEKMKVLKSLEPYMPEAVVAYEPVIFPRYKNNILDKLQLPRGTSCPCQRFNLLVQEAKPYLSNPRELLASPRR